MQGKLQLPQLSRLIRHNVEIARGSVGTQPLGAPGAQPGGVDARQEDVGDEHLPGLGGVAHTRGDIDVDPEVVAAQLAR